MSAPQQPYVRWDADASSIWLEPTSDDECLGLCLGTGATKAEAIADAKAAIVSAAEQLDRLEQRSQTLSNGR